MTAVYGDKDFAESFSRAGIDVVKTATAKNRFALLGYRG